MESEPVPAWTTACAQLIEACDNIRAARKLIDKAHARLHADHPQHRLSAIADELLSAAEDLCEQQANDVNDEMLRREQRKERPNAR